jgi:large subunit ribosomal protein L31
MKPDIHPEFNEIEVSCVCGNKFIIGSTQKTLRVDICFACHPAYKGNEGKRIIDAEGRVERFKRRFGNTATAAAAKG